jgi:hypothetical protein
LSGALHLFEIFKHEGLNGFKGVPLICHGMLQEMGYDHNFRCKI